MQIILTKTSYCITLSEKTSISWDIVQGNHKTMCLWNSAYKYMLHVDKFESIIVNVFSESHCAI
jgi:hypothetical protein